MTQPSICYIENRSRAFLNGHSFKANLGQISYAHANRGKLYTLLTSLHSWWPLLNLDLELGYVLLIRRLKQNNFFSAFRV